MKCNHLLFLVLLALATSFQALSQTSHTIITLDGTSPSQYINPLNDSVPSLGYLLSGIEAQFGAIEDSSDKLNKLEDKLILLEKSNILSRIARLNRKYYAALIEMGFSPDEAMKLIVANPIVELLKLETAQKTRSISPSMEIQ